jgi:hypothetical protein
MPKDCVDNMGKCQDMKQCEIFAHIDDVDRCHCIAMACNFIYKKNYVVDSAAVKRLLQKDCLVPSAVSGSSPSSVIVSTNYSRMCFLTNWQHSAFACSA